MLLTLEMRWFHPGTMPPAVLDWFRQDAGGSEWPATRIDRYLQVPDTDSLGIKVREGRLEVKQRRGVQERLALHAQVAGRAEHWCKWSFPVDAASVEFARSPQSSPDWIEVHKTRWSRRYQLLADGRVVSAPTGLYPEQGCNWEVTQVLARGQAGWTVGLEAFGAAASLHRSLLSAAERILGLGSPPVLRDECSFGYPSWLIVVMQGDGARAHQD